VRQLFARAAASPPCIVFFDELDALCPNRGSDSANAGGSSERVVNQLLTEMDGLDARQQLSVVAATNRPDMIDPAMLRPGRLDRCLYVPLPPAGARAEILRTACRKLALAPDVDLESLGADRKCDGYSGADLAALVKEAAIAALCECADEEEEPLVARRHFAHALDKVAPSVTRRDEKRYLAMRHQMHASRTRPVREADAEPDASGGAEANGAAPPPAG
jgi:ribosome biogenesis ATPase